ncbi:MAG: murein DD-endopeptidase MepM/ murein hydrolase activator NlpD [Nitriliruptoraceae bacterium]
MLAVLLLAVPAPHAAANAHERTHAVDAGLRSGPATLVYGVRLARPLAGRVIASFYLPTRYGAGHRGVDIEASRGTPVGAAARGRVTFAGTVVGHRWVTVDHGDVRTTVGPLDRIDVRARSWVVRGAQLGTSGVAHGRQALHWSARAEGRYVDPLRTTVLVATLVAGPGAVAARLTARSVDGVDHREVPSREPGALHRAFARFR